MVSLSLTDWFNFPVIRMFTFQQLRGSLLFSWASTPPQKILMSELSVWWAASHHIVETL